MTPSEIIETHAIRQGQNPELLSSQVKQFLRNPKTQIVQQGDCLFLIQSKDNIGYFHIFNGGNAANYIRSVRMFIIFMKKLGYQELAMRVQDKQQSQKIAASVGVKSAKYQEVGGNIDPYLMIMEI